MTCGVPTQPQRTALHHAASATVHEWRMQPPGRQDNSRTVSVRFSIFCRRSTSILTKSGLQSGVSIQAKVLVYTSCGQDHVPLSLMSYVSPLPCLLPKHARWLPPCATASAWPALPSPRPHPTAHALTVCPGSPLMVGHAMALRTSSGTAMLSSALVRLPGSAGEGGREGRRGEHESMGEGSRAHTIATATA